MGGFFGFGQSGVEKDSIGNLNNVFNYALPTAKAGQAAGNTNLGAAGDYFTSLLKAGRQDTAVRSAPVINGILDRADARRRQLASEGTARTGGAVESSREQDASTDKAVSDVINENLVGGQQQGAKGLADVGSTELANAATLLGLGSKGQEGLYEGALGKEAMQTGGFGRIISALL